MRPPLRALTATLVALTVGACEDSVTEGSGVITEVTMHVGDLRYALGFLVRPGEDDPVSVLGGSMFSTQASGPRLSNGGTELVKSYGDMLHERSSASLDAISCQSRRPREECLAPRLTVYREVFEDFFRFEDVEPDSPAYGFVRASMIAVVEAFEQGEPFRREDAEQLATGEWPLPNLPAEYR